MVKSLMLGVGILLLLLPALVSADESNDCAKVVLALKEQKSQDYTLIGRGAFSLTVKSVQDAPLDPLKLTAEHAKKLGCELSSKDAEPPMKDFIPAIVQIHYPSERIAFDVIRPRALGLILPPVVSSFSPIAPAPVGSALLPGLASADEGNDCAKVVLALKEQKSQDYTLIGRGAFSLTVKSVHGALDPLKLTAEHAKKLGCELSSKDKNAEPPMKDFIPAIVQIHYPSARIAFDVVRPRVSGLVLPPAVSSSTPIAPAPVGSAQSEKGTAPAIGSVRVEGMDQTLEALSVLTTVVGVLLGLISALLAALVAVLLRGQRVSSVSAPNPPDGGPPAQGGGTLSSTTLRAGSPAAPPAAPPATPPAAQWPAPRGFDATKEVLGEGVDALRDMKNVRLDSVDVLACVGKVLALGARLGAKKSPAYAAVRGFESQASDILAFCANLEQILKSKQISFRVPNLGEAFKPGDVDVEVSQEVAAECRPGHVGQVVDVLQAQVGKQAALVGTWSWSKQWQKHSAEFSALSEELEASALQASALRRLRAGSLEDEFAQRPDEGWVHSLYRAPLSEKVAWGREKIEEMAQVLGHTVHLPVRGKPVSKAEYDAGGLNVSLVSVNTEPALDTIWEVLGAGLDGVPAPVRVWTETHLWEARAADAERVARKLYQWNQSLANWQSSIEQLQTGKVIKLFEQAGSDPCWADAVLYFNQISSFHPSLEELELELDRLAKALLQCAERQGLEVVVPRVGEPQGPGWMEAQYIPKNLQSVLSGKVANGSVAYVARVGVPALKRAPGVLTWSKQWTPAASAKNT